MTGFGGKKRCGHHTSDYGSGESKPGQVLVHLLDQQLVSKTKYK